jgi:8-amino-7-oxononanoate synthase
MKRQPLHNILSELQAEHQLRRRTTIDGFVDAGNRLLTSAGGGTLVDFSSNDYLGLAHHPAVAAEMSACASRTGAGSAASHLITGHGIEHQRLEEELAAFLGRERALLFSTGYMANLGVMTALAGRGEQVLLDRLSHASIIDGALLSGARFKRYAHNDAVAAERALAEGADDVAVLATDGVFSMDGDLAPLPGLAKVATASKAWLVVDDAHGIGVLGAQGRGSLEHFGMTPDDVPVLVGTLGKALGSFGAFVAGSRDLIEYLVQRARPYIYTTALPQPVAAATRKALEIAQRERWRRERVLALTARFRRAARSAGIPLMNPEAPASHPHPASARSPIQNPAVVQSGSAHQFAPAPPTPIQPVVLGSSEAALSAQQELLRAGFRVVAIRAPTVARGSERLRITLSAAHTEEQVDGLVDALSHVFSQHTGIHAPLMDIDANTPG